MSEVGMMDTDSRSEINTAHGYVQTDRGRALLPHLRWELEQVMGRVRPVDLSAVEIGALLAILMPAHSRVIGGPAGRPGLRVLGVRG
jgi:hypothetical protein